MVWALYTVKAAVYGLPASLIALTQQTSGQSSQFHCVWMTCGSPAGQVKLILSSGGTGARARWCRGDGKANKSEMRLLLALADETLYTASCFKRDGGGVYAVLVVSF